MRRISYFILSLILVLATKQVVFSQTIGVLYGILDNGNRGVFSYDPLTSNYSEVLTFNGNYGSNIIGNLMQASNGLLYGTTENGGLYNYGLLYSVNPSTGKDSILFNFNAPNSVNPFGTLLQDTNGLLYGMTYAGGKYGDGTIYSYDPVKGTLNDTLFSFNNTNGANPYFNNCLILASNGSLYGMTYGGGKYGQGVLFSYNVALNTDTVLINFSGNANGSNPYGYLIQGSDGELYGMTEAGGSFNDGVIFRYNINTGSDTVLYNFKTEGISPYGSLVQASNGLLYGMTNQGGRYGYGVIFKYDPLGLVYDTISSFNGTNGIMPYGSFIKGDDSVLYGMTRGGGANGYGTIVSYKPTATNDSVVLSFSNSGGAPFEDLLEIMSATITNTNVSCYGDSSGTATLKVRGGKYPLKYSWSNGDSTDSISKLPAGNYSVKITDAVGKGVSLNCIIKQPSKLVDTVSKLTNEKCYGDSNASIIMAVSGGVKPYSYAWSPVAQTNSFVNGLIKGTYTFTVNDSNNCKANKIITITQPPILNDSIVTSTNVLCYGLHTGSARIGVRGGTKPYSFLWSSGAGTDSVTSNLAAGTYTCQVTDSNSCKTSALVKITSPPEITDSTIYTSTPCTKSTGSAGVVNVSGGVPPYSFFWSPGNDTNNIDTALPSGMYTCTITDSNKCTINVSVFIPNTGGPKDSLVMQTNELCYGQNIGTATVSVNGGKKPYTFNWSPTVPSGENDTIATGLSAGAYIFSATDSIGCINTVTVNITQPLQLIDSAASVTNVNCYGLSDGSITIGVKGGIAPYTYAWTNLPITDSIAAGLPVGTYSFTVTDKNHCTSGNMSVTLTSPPIIVVDTSSTSTKCGRNNGSVQVNVSGGVVPYKYLWANINDTTSRVTGLPGGIAYTCQVVDANGCKTYGYATVADTGGPQAFAYIHDQIKCYGDSSGSAIDNVTKGVPPFQYLWAPAGGTNAFAINLGAGTYSCTLTDSTGCKQVSTVIINQPLQIKDTIYTVGVCNSFITGGQAKIYVSGGIPPYSYLWNTKSSSDSINNVGPGAYLCTVTDSNKCKLYATCNIVPASPIKVDSVVSHPSSCLGCDNGWAKAFVSGGIPQGDSAYYLYVWDNAQTTDSISGLDTGVYHVCVTTNYCTGQTACDSVIIVTGLTSIVSGVTGIKVYPTITTGIVNVKLLFNSKVTCNLFNELGQMIYSDTQDEYKDEIILNINKQANGLYFLQVVTSHGQVTQKIVLSK